MDLTNVKTYCSLSSEADCVAVGPGDQYLGAGSWLYSAPHPSIKRLIDVSDVEAEDAWIKISDGVVRISAATRLGWLSRYTWPDSLRAGNVFAKAIQGLSASFKVIERATVGGNISLSLAKGAVGPACVALGAEYLLQSASGGQRRIPAQTFQTGSQCNLLKPGERLLAVLIPEKHLDADWALKRLKMTSTSHVIASVIALRYAAPDRLRMSISATLVYPLALEFSDFPKKQEAVIEAIDNELPHHPYMEDQHGSARYRHAMARYLASEAYAELK